MPRPAKIKNDIRRRRANGGPAARLIEWGRRHGLMLAGAALLIGGGAALYISSLPADTLAALRAQGHRITAQAGFTVQDILVEGRIHSDADVLRAVLNVQRGDPIFAFDPAEARDLIERISWVREAHVERRLPHTIYIGLIERAPLALWQNKGKIRVVDADGVTLTDALRRDFSDLPLIVGEGAPAQAPAFLTLLAAEPDLAARMDAATWVGARRWDMKMKNGITVQLPEGDVGLALRRLAQAQDDDGLLDRDVTIIDMRAADRIAVSMRAGAMEEYKARTAKEKNAKGGNDI